MKGWKRGVEFTNLKTPKQKGGYGKGKVNYGDSLN